MRSNDDRSAEEIALGLLQRREHTSRELRRKMKARGIGDGEIESVLTRLTELGFLNDRRAAEMLVKEELRKRPVGKTFLLAKLRQRGVSDSIIDELLGPLDETWETGQAKDAATRWLRRQPRAKQRRDPLMRHLQSRGFGWSSIRFVLDCVAASESEDVGEE